MAKTDIENAFRIIPIHPDDRHFLGFSWVLAEGNIQYYMDACLAMGLASSCQLFTRFSSALQWVMETRYQASMSHIIDDFFFCGPKNSPKCAQSLVSFLAMCKSVGIPIKQEKTEGPSTCMTIYGIEVDSDDMILRLPVDKVSKIRMSLQDIAKRKKVTLKALQSIYIYIY